MLLSIACATFNEENNISRLLDNLKGFADEVVFVDGSSKDRTVEIAKKYNVKVISTTNPKNFHINKQKAIDLCKSDWILQIDADELLSKELKEEIIKTLKDKEKIKSTNGFWIPRKNYFLNKFLEKGGQYPDYTLRLYRNGKGKLPCKSVHEQAKVEGQTLKLINPLFHYPYPNFSHYLKHFNIYTDISSDEIKSKINFVSFIRYFVFLPFYWFIKTYFRHRGYYDGFPGFVFSFFSALHYPVSYIKYWEKKKNHEQD